MFYKTRTKSMELIILESLNNRMELSSKEKQHYFSIKKGYEGEKKFDSYMESLQSECLILSDLLLEVNHTAFQIDSLMISSEKIYLFDVKNFEGDYYFASDKFFKKPKLEITNPLHQLSRAESLLRQLLLRLKIKIPIESSVIFINPHFTLYQAPLDKPIIFPTQMNQFIANIHSMPSKFTARQKIIAEKLISLHIANSPYKKIPSYRYEQLKKGIVCPNCFSFSVYLEGKKCICEDCGSMELATNAILRGVKEFQTLFPNEKITTNRIHDWCHIVPTKKRVREVLKKNFRIVGVHRWTHYE